ncbi:hypothetical protein [Streptomyces chryseus]|uniref:Integral membrane protein n=1 Tax=Streptomyces chryseus TaxID=68186 RepID=A0ABQ3DX57_9ACTN|nr:hypothetical protein [Streptomyces chryseus]GHB16441.1 hypothetical protein GCM10010346_45360 [Streptomyces chryseus]
MGGPGAAAVGAAAVLVAGLVPHLVHAVRETGSPLGMVLSATSQASRAYVGDGLVHCLAVFPYRPAGDLGAVVMAAGLWEAGAAALRVRRARGGGPGVREADRRRAILGMAAVLVLVILGRATDGEPRFVYLAVVLLTVLGVRAPAELAGPGVERARTALTAALAGLTVLGTTQVVAHGAMPGPTRLAWSTVPVAREIGAAAGCGVAGVGRGRAWLGGVVLSVGWCCGGVPRVVHRGRRLSGGGGTVVSS